MGPAPGDTDTDPKWRFAAWHSSGSLNHDFGVGGAGDRAQSPFAVARALAHRPRVDEVGPENRSTRPRGGTEPEHPRHPPCLGPLNVEGSKRLQSEAMFKRKPVCRTTSCQRSPSDSSRSCSSPGVEVCTCAPSDCMRAATSGSLSTVFSAALS